jgi:hypothetical protein
MGDERNKWQPVKTEMAHTLPINKKWHDPQNSIFKKGGSISSDSGITICLHFHIAEMLLLKPMLTSLKSHYLNKLKETSLWQWQI